LAGFVLAAVVCLCGCHGPYQAKSDEDFPLEHQENISLMDKKLQKWMRIDALSYDYTSDGRLEVYCEMRNRTDVNLEIMVQTQFKDAAGRLLEDKTNWETIVIPKNATIDYRPAAMTERARNFIIRVKRPI
jgi:hypothetical protein